MDTFAIIVFGGLALVLVCLVGLGGLSRRRVRDITDRRDDETLGARALIEERDVPEMVDAQNRYRRLDGRPERSEREVRQRVGARELQRLDRADAEAKERARQKRD